MRATAFAFLVLLATAPAKAAGPILSVLTSAVPEVVFQHARDACERADVPDVSARAWRDAEGRVHLLASHYVNRRMSGPDLNSIKPDCTIIFEGAHLGDPAAFNDRGWIAAIHTADGRTVDALVHNEFHGQEHPALCPAGRYMQCWFNAITALRSTDGGRSFSRLPDDAALVATLPYRYRGDLGRHSGIFAPSNIVTLDRFLYAFVWAEPLEAQKRGACLIRTDAIADPSRWRAFDGRGFGTRFADPYRETLPDPAAHACVPLAPKRLFGGVRSVVRHQASAWFIALITAVRPGGTGIWSTTSPDLLQWSEPRLLLEVPLLNARDCTRPTAFYYPALLDPLSDDRNFETVGDSAFLYLTRLNLTDCRITWDRDLVRLPVSIRAGG